MQNFKNILYVANSVLTVNDSLVQALSLTRNNNATLTIFVLYPNISNKYIEDVEIYAEKFREFITKQVDTTINEVCAKYKIDKANLNIKTILQTLDREAIQIVQHVLRNANDLVIKDAESSLNTTGFKAIDMELLRICPCPVWLCRPITKHRDKISVAVAIDPKDEEQAAHDLSIRLLELADSIAQTCNKELKVISCWDFKYEEEMLENQFFRISKSELKVMLNNMQTNNLESLNHLIDNAKLSSTIDINHQRGNPENIIQSYITDHDIDILIMGTVARTGILNFLIGNTAENIMQQITCSLLAVKPNGFVSPVKAY